MICVKCRELGQKSRVYHGTSFSTCAYYTPYYDEEGVYHSHDGNVHTTTYTCSNGHHITVSGIGKCPSCNWGHDKDTVTVKDVSNIILVDGTGSIVNFSGKLNND